MDTELRWVGILGKAYFWGPTTWREFSVWEGRERRRRGYFKGSILFLEAKRRHKEGGGGDMAKVFTHRCDQ